MKQEMITLPKKVYDELLEEIGILRNPKMMDAVNEGIGAEKKGIKSWELKF